MIGSGKRRLVLPVTCQEVRAAQSSSELFGSLLILSIFRFNQSKNVTTNIEYMLILIVVGKILGSTLRGDAKQRKV